MNSQLETVVFEMEKAVRGKRGVIEHILAALLAEGHILLDDMPGVGKTTLAVALSRAVDLRYRRVQFTPDVMPSDIVGFSVYEPQSGQFVYHEGAATHANLLLGDEINRTSSKTQSALLEAMEERQITVDGRTYPLEKPFVVIATQNNVGTAGTQFLPYAQVDRFMVRLSVGYPDHDEQMALLRDRLSENPLDAVEQVLTREELLAMASREHPNIEVGVSPRGALLLCRMAKARAYLLGRAFAVSEDVQAVFEPVCAHRLIVSAKARLAGVSAGDVVRELLADVPNPDRAAL